MSYYTEYTLTASVCPLTDNGFAAASPPIPRTISIPLEDEIKKLNVFGCGNIEDGYWVCTKWYNWEEDMALLSKRLPELLFCLHGEGEDSGDLWNAYFFQGRCQYCPATITYDAFNPTKLSCGKESEISQKGIYSNQIR